MPNSILYNVNSQSLSLKKGNFWIGTGDVGKGPSSSTGYFDGIIPGSNQYVIYYNKSGSNRIYYCANGDQVYTITNRLKGQNLTTLESALAYIATQSDMMCTNINYEPIITNGLILNLDAGFLPSYPKSGTTLYDMSNTYNGTLNNGPTYSSLGGGSIVFDETDDNCYVGGYPNFALPQFTLSTWCYPTNAGNGSGAGRIIAGYTDVNNWTYGYGIFTYPYRALGPQVNFFVNNGSNPSYIQLLISNNIWLNLVLTYDGTTQRAYSNGIYLSSLTRTVSYFNTNRFTVGDGYLYNSPFKGNISNTFLYNRALTDSEVLQNYNAQKGRFGL